MKKYCLFLTLLSFPLTAQGQSASFFVIGDNVNIRPDTLMSSQSLSQALWGAKYIGEMVSENWFAFYNEVDGAQRYIHASMVADREQFCTLAQQKPDINGAAKIELMTCYLETGNMKSLPTAIDLINNHTNEPIYPGFEQCDLVGHLAYRTLLGGLNQPSRLTTTNRLLEVVTDSTMRALILVDDAKFSGQMGRWAEAEKNLFDVLENYAAYLFIPFPCEYDSESKMYPMMRFSNLFFSVFHLAPGDLNQRRRRLSALTNSANAATSLLARDLSRNTYGMFWNRKAYLDYKNGN